MRFVLGRAVAGAFGLIGAMAMAQPAGAAGKKIFDGETAVPGRILGHQEALPTDSSKCSNCHRPPISPGSANPVPATQAFGPALTRRLLREPVKRRGGPASRYEEASFCKLLRTGVDPAFIVIPRSMPRYEMTDPQCGALWSYLVDASP